MNMRSNSELFPRQISLNLALTFRHSLFTDALDSFYGVGIRTPFTEERCIHETTF